MLVSDERDARRFRLLEAGLGELLRSSGASHCVLASPDGHPLCQRGASDEMDTTSIAALASAALMCIESMGGGLDADAGRAVLEGRCKLLFLARPSAAAILVVVCDGKGQLGRVRLLAEDFALSYGLLLEALLPPVSMPPSH